MRKHLFLDKNRRSCRLLWGALLFCLAAGWSGAFAEDGAAVVSLSPLGMSNLGWVKPGDSVPKGERLPEQNTEMKLYLVEEDGESVELGSPIKPVRLLEKNSEGQAVSPAPVHLAQIEPDLLPDNAAKGRVRNDKRSKNIYADECPDPHKLASIKDMGYKVVSTPGEFPQSCPLPEEVYTRKLPTPIVFTWKASALCHKPLYFEDVQLERYGHTLCPILQPALSGVRFWLTIPILPYLMGTYPPNECIYDLGYYRPGSCAPSMIQPLPISLRGGLIEAGAVVGAAAAIP